MTHWREWVRTWKCPSARKKHSMSGASPPFRILHAYLPAMGSDLVWCTVVQNFYLITAFHAKLPLAATIRTLAYAIVRWRFAEGSILNSTLPCWSKGTIHSETSCESNVIAIFHPKSTVLRIRMNDESRTTDKTHVKYESHGQNDPESWKQRATE